MAVISMCDDRHRHQEWLKFLRVIDDLTPPEKQLHLTAGNYATHKHPKAQRWLAGHPRIRMHFTPTSSSWLKKLVGYLSRDETEALLVAPDQTQWAGRRDHALLLTMYNSGARVSELASMQRNQLQFGASTFVQLHGKGRKERTVPLWPNTARVLRAWLQEPRSAPADVDVVFPNARGVALTRDGVDYLLKRAVEKAAAACPSLATKPVSPHVIRHTTGVHLLQSGVDITVIALWLGHESIETTHIYVEDDLTTKEKALQKLPPVETLAHRYKADDALLAFLNAI